MNLIPNIPAKAFSFSAVVVGYLLIDDLTANEQIALGNWLMLIAQVLCTNAFYKQVQQERATNSQNNQSCGNISTEESIEMLKKMVDFADAEVLIEEEEEDYRPDRYLEDSATLEKQRALIRAQFDKEIRELKFDCN